MVLLHLPLYETCGKFIFNILESLESGLKIMKSFSSQAVMTGESLAGLVACVARFVLFGIVLPCS